MKKKRGFTLIELLVVIAIIALLMAIMMPALEFVRKQAKTTICQTLLKQWGLLFAMYADDNDNKFMSGLTNYPKDKRISEGDWMVALLPYYQGKGIRLCPMAEKIGTTGEPGQFYGGKFEAWQRIDYIPDPTDPTKTILAEGSYGVNCWVYAPNPGFDWGVDGQPPGAGKNDYWRGPDVKGAGYIPVFCDCMWYGRHPCDGNVTKGSRNDGPPQNDDVPHDVGLGSSYCINRHDGTVNHVFMDWTVRSVGLKELWRLKWHRSFSLDNPYVKQGAAKPTCWPPWMYKFPEY